MKNTPEHYYEGRDLEVLADMPNYHDSIVGPFYPYLGNRVVEYGAGRGAISGLLAARVDDLLLVEPSPNLAAHLQTLFSDRQHLSIASQSLEEHVAGQADGSVDAVVMVNVLEHVKDDEQALRELHRLLRAGGHLCLFVPAMSWLFSELDRRVGHYRRYHKPGLRKIVRDAGFEIVSARYFDLIGVFPWWLINRVMGRTDFGSPVLAKIFDTFLVPLNRLIEAVFPLPFGKNILLIAKKPSQETRNTT